jgi:cysteine desulfurase
MRVSHVLAALGLPDDVAAGSLRITLGRPTTETDVSYAAAAIVDVVREETARLGIAGRRVGEK